MDERPVQCDICGKDAKDGWQYTHCRKCALEVDVEALESRLNDLTEELERKEEQLYNYRSEMSQCRGEKSHLRVENDRFQRKVARLQRQLEPFVELVSLAREARDCGSLEARTLFVRAAVVRAAVEGCANVSLGENELIPAPEDLR